MGTQAADWPARPVTVIVGYARVGRLPISPARSLPRVPGFEAVHIPFRGSGQVTAALLGGQIDMFFGNASDLVPQAESGKVRLLGVATPQPMKQLPDVPTISSTFVGFSLASWNGFLAPAKTPREIIDKLARHVSAAAQGPHQCRAAHSTRYRAEWHDAARISRADRP